MLGVQIRSRRSRESLDEWRLPNFLIIGAPRSGTSTLATNLSDHPQAFVPPQKELKFFDFEFHRGIRWYSRQFRDAGASVAVGESSPTYLYSPAAAERIAEILPDARLIVILRDPVDRAYSDYLHARTFGRESLSFEDALQEEVRGKRLWSADRSLQGSYLSRGRYAEHLQRFLQPRDGRSLQIIMFEDLRDSPFGTFSSVCSFLGIDSAFEPPSLGMIVNPQYDIFGLRLWMFLYRWRWRWPWVQRFATAMARIQCRPRVRYPPMSPRLRRWLTDYFAEPNAQLSEWLGVEIPATWLSAGVRSIDAMGPANG